LIIEQYLAIPITVARLGRYKEHLNHSSVSSPAAIVAE